MTPWAVLNEQTLEDVLTGPREIKERERERESSAGTAERLPLHLCLRGEVRGIFNNPVFSIAPS